MSTLTDPIADFLTRLRNAAGSHRADVKLPYSKIKEEIARILKEEGYIAEYEVDHSSRPAVLKTPFPRAATGARCLVAKERQFAKPALIATAIPIMLTANFECLFAMLRSLRRRVWPPQRKRQDLRFVHQPARCARTRLTQR